jgi:1,4-dihydroxy-6-naphthoate synthase
MSYSKTIRLGFSPCPNDTFIFDALVNGKIDTRGYRFEVVMEDVEALNRMSRNGELELSKMSYHAYLHQVDKWLMLRSGGAMGHHCGPLLISLQEPERIVFEDAQVAIPGWYTTANFLLSFAYPMAKNKVEVIFSEIENALLQGKVDLGVIIHENRFTYMNKGLTLVRDLGEHWETETGFPIPLGGIAIRRDLQEQAAAIQALIRESVEYAFRHPNDSKDYVKCIRRKWRMR